MPFGSGNLPCFRGTRLPFGAVDGRSETPGRSLRSDPPPGREFARPMADTHKYVYSFGDGKAEGKADMKALLGGKGANLAEMSVIGIPAPPGFTITTEVCAQYYDLGRKLPEAVRPQVEAAVKLVEAEYGGK